MHLERFEAGTLGGSEEAQGKPLQNTGQRPGGLEGDVCEVGRPGKKHGLYCAHAPSSRGRRIGSTLATYLRMMIILTWEALECMGPFWLLHRLHYGS